MGTMKRKAETAQLDASPKKVKSILKQENRLSNSHLDTVNEVKTGSEGGEEKKKDAEGRAWLRQQVDKMEEALKTAVYQRALILRFHAEIRQQNILHLHPKTPMAMRTKYLQACREWSETSEKVRLYMKCREAYKPPKEETQEIEFEEQAPETSGAPEGELEQSATKQIHFAEKQTASGSSSAPSPEITILDHEPDRPQRSSGSKTNGVESAEGQQDDGPPQQSQPGLTIPTHLASVPAPGALAQPIVMDSLSATGSRPSSSRGLGPDGSFGMGNDYGLDQFLNFDMDMSSAAVSAATSPAFQPQQGNDAEGRTASTNPPEVTHTVSGNGQPELLGEPAGTKVEVPTDGRTDFSQNPQDAYDQEGQPHDPPGTQGAQPDEEGMFGAAGDFDFSNIDLSAYSELFALGEIGGSDDFGGTGMAPNANDMSSYLNTAGM